jgi:hypothetical protein
MGDRNEKLSPLPVHGKILRVALARPAVTETLVCGYLFEADARTRTGDPFITSEVLYQLSYVGAGIRV